MQQIPAGHVTNARISVKEFAAKFQSKRECYNFLAGEYECYLPPYGKSPIFLNLMIIFI